MEKLIKRYQIISNLSVRYCDYYWFKFQAGTSNRQLEQINNVRNKLLQKYNDAIDRYNNLLLSKTNKLMRAL